MSASLAWSWLGLLVLGAGHDLNPGMGWLFAVALGLQERRERAVWRPLPPLALGHALAIAVAVALVAAAGSSWRRGPSVDVDQPRPDMGRRPDLDRLPHAVSLIGRRN